MTLTEPPKPLTLTIITDEAHNYRNTFVITLCFMYGNPDDLRVSYDNDHVITTKSKTVAEQIITFLEALYYSQRGRGADDLRRRGRGWEYLPFADVLDSQIEWPADPKHPRQYAALVDYTISWFDPAGGEHEVAIEAGPILPWR